MESSFTNTPEDRKKFFTFIYLAMILALITGVEIVIIWLPLSRSLILWTLGILSVVKFLGVIWWFMHMRWDRAVIAVIFFLGLLIGGGSAVMLWSLFAFDPYAPIWDEREASLAHESGGLVEKVTPAGVQPRV